MKEAAAQTERANVHDKSLFLRQFWDMEAQPHNTALHADEKATCDRCGKFDAFDIAGRKLCGDCYQIAGSCCPEFGADDLWQPERGCSLINEQ